MDSQVDAEEVVYVLDQVVLRGEDFLMRADRVVVRLDAVRYAAYLGDGEVPPQPPVPDRYFVPGLLSRKLLLTLGLPEEESLIRLIELEGAVRVEQIDYELDCSRLRIWPTEGRAEIDDVELRLPPGSGAPNGWPLTVRAAHVREDADGSVVAEFAAFSTCNADPLHWSVRFSVARAERTDDGKLRWRPEGAWLRAGRIPIIPLPSTQFGEGDSFLGFRGIRLESSNHWGFMVEPRFGWRWRVPRMDVLMDTELFLGFSSRRGVPIRVEGEVLSGILESDFSFFALDDNASDRHPFADVVARTGDSRWRARWDTRTHFDDAWTLETNFAMGSDPLVDPEFFNREWTTEDDVRNRIYLKRRGDDALFEATLQYRLDDFGYTPLEGYGTPGSQAPRTLDTLPKLRFEAFSDSLGAVPGGWFGGEDGAIPLNFTYGAEVAQLQLRDQELESAVGVPFAGAPTAFRDRARTWAELAAPASLSGAFLRPGVRLTASAWNDREPVDREDSQAHIEGFVETGVVLQRRWEDGWMHRVLPQLRFRSRSALAEPEQVPLDFDGNDQVMDGEIIEMSLRQFFVAPGQSEPWMDLDLIVPWYPNDAELLRSDYAPFPRTSQTEGGIGPAELRLVWTPGGLDDALEGLRWEARVRHDFQTDQWEEWFTRLRVQPQPGLFYGLEYYDSSEGTPEDFAIGSVFAAYRFAEEWGAGFRQSENFAGDAGLNSAYMLHHYGHDFLYEVGWTRREATGEEGFYFYVTPRFLEESYGSGSLAQLRWN